MGINNLSNSTNRPGNGAIDEKIKQLTLRLSLFKDIDPKYIISGLELGKIKINKFKAGEPICIQGKTYIDSFFVLLDGKIEIYQNDEIISRINNLYTIGEIGFLCPELGRTASVIASGDSITMKFSRDFINNLPEDIKYIMYRNFCYEISKKIVESDKIIQNILGITNKEDSIKIDAIKNNELIKVKEKRIIDHFENVRNAKNFENILKVLSDCSDIFKGIDLKFIREYLNSSDTEFVDAKAGAYLIEEGVEVCDYFYILCRGKLGIYKKDIKVAMNDKICTVGEIGFILQNFQRIAHVKVEEDSCLLKIKRKFIDRLEQINKKILCTFYINLSTSLAKKLISMDEFIMDDEIRGVTNKYLNESSNDLDIPPEILERLFCSKIGVR